MSAEMYTGDTLGSTWSFRDATGAAVDLTGAAARFQLRSGEDLVLAAASGSPELVITPLTGVVTLLIPYADTALTPGSYLYELEVTHASGVRRTYDHDTLLVKEDVAHD